MRVGEEVEGGEVSGGSVGGWGGVVGCVARRGEPVHALKRWRRGAGESPRRLCARTAQHSTAQHLPEEGARSVRRLVFFFQPHDSGREKADRQASESSSSGGDAG